jgi:PAS domain S-box-containing protein
LNAEQNGKLPPFAAIGATRTQYLAALRCAMVVLLLLVAGIAQAQNDSAKPLVVGSEEDYPPFSIGKTDETAGGFTVELWKAVAAEQELSYTIRVRPFRQLLEEYKAGQIDVLINLAQSDERRAFADFSVPNVIDHGAIFVRRDESRIRSEADLAGKEIIVLNADLAHDYAVSKGWERQLVLVDNVADGLKLLASGKHDSMLLSKFAGTQTLLEEKIRNVTALKAKAGFSQKFSFAVQKGNTQLLAKVNEGLATVKTAGTHDALYEKWFGVFEVREATLRDLLKYFGPVAIAVLIFTAIVLVRQRERNKGEEALRTSVEFTNSLISSMQDGFAVLDAKGVQSDVNPAFCAMTGLSREELIGIRAPYPYWPPEEHERIRVALTEALKGNVSNFELTFMRRNGERFPVIVSPAAVKNQTGDTVSYCATVKDVTELKRAEEERTKLLHSLEESQVRLQTLVANLPGMAYRCLNDANWTMTYVSEGCEAVTSYRRDELENNRAVAYADLIHPEDRDWLWAKCQKSLDARIPCQNEYRLVDRHGRHRWVSERASGVYAEDGTLLAIDGFIQDITAARRAKTERELLDRKVQETQKLESLGVLAGGIAHDFNNLLSSILGNTGVAQLELPPGSSVQECLEHINEASLRAADLCKQMLAYSGRGHFVVQTLDLGELVEQTAQMLKISISKKAVVRFRLKQGLPPVKVDATQLRQVIMNLVINASEAIGDTSGVIGISTGLTHVDRDYLHGTLMGPDLPAGDYVFLEVSDSGCGMSAETRTRIFDPFFTTKFTGRGLGLAAVLGIVRGHQGAMMVDSAPCRGTTFKLLFPAATGARETAKAPQEASPAWQGKGTVLVVDDEETMRSTIARMMPLMGFDHVLAADGREAVEIFRANPAQFTLVLLDLTMPHMDGEQTFFELRRLRPDVRVVLMSGFNAHEALVRFKGKGLASFLQKPFTIASLRTTIHAVLDGKESAPPDRMTMPHVSGEETFRELRQLQDDAQVISMSGDNEQDVTSRFVGNGLDGSIQKPFRRRELLEKIRERLGEGETVNEPETILVIDDEQIVRESTKALLQSFGYVVLTASNGQGGIDSLQEHVDGVAVVLLDFQLPDMRADAVFQELRQHSNVPVVLLTGNLTPDIAEEYQEMGFAATLEKPLPVETLLNLLREVLQTAT